MYTFYLTPTAISDLTLLIFAGFITGYLSYLSWSLRKKRPFQIIFIFLTFASLSSYILLDFLNQTLYPDLRFWILPLQSIVITFGMVWLVQFAYRMPASYPERRRESRIALGVTLLLPLWETGYATTRYARLLEGKIIYRPANVDVFLTAVFIWMLIVFLRQMGSADTRSISLWRKFWQPEGHSARAARRMALISLLPVALTAILIANPILSATIASISLSMGLLLAMLLFVLVYLNYLPEHTSFMLRLSAITLAFFLAILGAVGQVMTPPYINAYHNHNLVAAPQTVRFTPNTQGGYDIDSLPYVYESFDNARSKLRDDIDGLGNYLNYSDNVYLRIPLAFEFPFYNQPQTELFTYQDGLITFGTANRPVDTLFHYGSLPSIYLLGTRYEPQQMLYVDSTPTQLTLTWFEMPEEQNNENQYTLQLRLYDSGVFEMDIVGLPADTHYDVNYRWQTAHLIGSLPGMQCDTVQLLNGCPSPTHIRFNNELPFSSGSNGIIEDYHLDFRTALHDFLMPLFWLTLFSAALVIIGIPLAFRQNLVRPLQNLLAGVRRVNNGRLDTHIPITAEDEFGYLTHSFNKMTAELNEMVTGLEERVAERTAQLADTTAHLDNILSSATDYAIATVDRNMRVTYINPMAETLYGVSAAEILGEFVTIIPSRRINAERFRAGLRRVETHGVHEYTRTIETPDGTRHITSRLSGIYDKQRQLIGYAHFSQDISQRVQTETQLQTQQRTLAALEERERIGRELHDGIGQVMGYLNLQMQSTRALLAEEKYQAADALLQRSVTAAQQAHNDVREFILGMKKPSIAPADFWTALQNYVQTFEEQSQIPVQLSLPADKPCWLTPPHDLHLLRIIQEALTNVRKHAAATQVQIIASQISADKAQFIISDNGRGFDTELTTYNELPPADTHPPSLHFGLDIMRERAAELNGRFEIRSTPGQGTQLLITVEIEPETEEAAPAAPLAPLRVLLADDHPLFREGLANVLKIYGITIVGLASNGLEAQQLVRQTQPDVIVMDIEMPVCDGIEATRLIKEEFPDQRIIMLTTSATDDTLFAALKAGASGYLLKSMGTEELFMLIAGLGDGVPPIAPELAGKVMAEFQRLTRPESKLSERQSQILELVANGRSYHEIASDLHVSERTVKRQMKQVMDVLHLDSRAEAEEYARHRLKNNL